MLFLFLLFSITYKFCCNLNTKEPINAISDNYKLEYIKCSITIIASILLYLIAAKCIVIFYNPNISQAIDYDRNLTISTALDPEPKEKLLFLSDFLMFQKNIYLYFLFCVNCNHISYWIFKFPYTYENRYDFNAVYYSIVQVFNGTPIIIV